MDPEAKSALTFIFYRAPWHFYTVLRARYFRTLKLHLMCIWRVWNMFPSWQTTVKQLHITLIINPFNHSNCLMSLSCRIFPIHSYNMTFYTCLCNCCWEEALDRKRNRETVESSVKAAIISGASRWVWAHVFSCPVLSFTVLVHSHSIRQLVYSEKTLKTNREKDTDSVVHILWILIVFNLFLSTGFMLAIMSVYTQCTSYFDKPTVNYLLPGRLQTDTVSNRQTGPIIS